MGEIEKLEGLSDPWLLFYAFLRVMSSRLQKQTKRWKVDVTSPWHKSQCCVWVDKEEITET